MDHGAWRDTPALVKPSEVDKLPTSHRTATHSLVNKPVSGLIPCMRTVLSHSMFQLSRNLNGFGRCSLRGIRVIYRSVKTSAWLKLRKVLHLHQAKPITIFAGRNSYNFLKNISERANVLITNGCPDLLNAAR